MSAEKPHNPIKQEILQDLQRDKNETIQELLQKLIKHEVSEKKQHYFWRKWLLIPLIAIMAIVPWLLFGVVAWIIFFSEPTTCPTMGMCEAPGLWTTKNIFVSGSFITLITFYTVLAKGLFGDNVKDKSFAERASDTAWSASNSSGGS